MILRIVIIVGLSILVLRWPYLGIAIILASLPLADILPSTSWASSVVVLFGGVTLGSYLLRQLRLRRSTEQGRSKMSGILVMGILFVLWIVLSDPSAAINPASDGRIWIMTFIQLWVFAWLTASLFDNPQKINILMYFFIVAAFISAVFASFQGVIGIDIGTSVRAAGLAEGANSATRYFIIAFMFALFLYSVQRKKTLKMLLIGGMAVLLYGVFLTVSRTGLLLLVGGLSLYIIRNFHSKRIAQSIFVLLLVLTVVWIFADNIVIISKSILPAVLTGIDTVGLRYRLWQAGIRMWFDHPIAGVGIGQFGENLTRYGWDLLSIHYLRRRLGAHNMYIAVLSETGIIGLVLFLLMFVSASRAILKTIRSKNNNVSELALNWLIVIILVLLAGLTKHDHYDKLNWIVIGIVVSISRIGEYEQHI